MLSKSWLWIIILPSCHTSESNRVIRHFHIPWPPSLVYLGKWIGETGTCIGQLACWSSSKAQQRDLRPECRPCGHVVSCDNGSWRSASSWYSFPGSDHRYISTSAQVSHCYLILYGPPVNHTTNSTTHDAHLASSSKRTLEDDQSSRPKRVRFKEPMTRTNFSDAHSWLYPHEMSTILVECMICTSKPTGMRSKTCNRHKRWRLLADQTVDPCTTRPSWASSGRANEIGEG